MGGAPLTYTLASDPLYGTLTGTVPVVVYTPMTNFVELDSFFFQASNGITQSQEAQVWVMVQPGPGDTTPPQVEWTEPGSGDLIYGVSATPSYTDSVGPLYAPSILVQFSEPLSSTTVSTATIQMANNGGSVPLAVGYDGWLHQATILLRQPWQTATYTITLSAGIKDASGNPLSAPYMWSFTAVGASVPTYTIYVPMGLKQAVP